MMTWGRRPVVMMVTLAVLAMCVWPRTGVRAAGSQHLYLVFAPGLCGWKGSDSYCHDPVIAARRAEATFSNMRAAIQTAGIHYQTVSYSYSPTNGPTYTVHQTHQHIAVSVQSLDAQLHHVLTQDAHARFVLVGYSLGGLVITSWMVTDGIRSSTAVMRRVHSIVTFDSPVDGSTALGQVPFGSVLFSGAVWSDLQPTSRTIRAITAQGDSWWRTTGKLHTVANSADLIVPPRDALLGQRRLVHDTQCPVDILFFRSCHGAVLNDMANNRWVACHWIVSGSPCAVTPTPTRTPVPTRTPTATPTVVPSPTSSPTATATATPSAVATVGPPPPP